MFSQYDSFKLARPLPDESVPVGTTGVILEIFEDIPASYEVEFPDGMGGNLGHELTYTLSEIAMLPVSLDELLVKHSKAAFPQHAEADDLEELLMVLLELDGYIIGLVKNPKNDVDNMKLSLSSDLEKLRERFLRISTKNEHDQEVKLKAQAYRTSLESIARALSRRRS